jgi:MYXO-CTERM domain-containing protein
MPSSRIRLGSVLLRLACAGLLLGGAAQARHDACDAPNRGSSACSTHVTKPKIRDVQPRGDSIAVVAGVGSTAETTLALWQPDRRVSTLTVPQPRVATDAEEAFTASGNEPPLLGLLLAVLGVVGFVAHRRSGR